MFTHEMYIFKIRGALHNNTGETSLDVKNSFALCISFFNADSLLINENGERTF